MEHPWLEVGELAPSKEVGGRWWAEMLSQRGPLRSFKTTVSSEIHGPDMFKIQYY